MPGAEPDVATPVWDVSVYAAVATGDAVAWAAVRPLLPEQPELARGIYELVPGVAYFAAARELAGHFDRPKPPWRQFLVPRGPGVVRIGVILLYGAIERAVRD